MAQKILATERGFWHDTAIPTYLITLLPSDDTPGSYAGTALEDSFSLFMSSSATLDFNTKFLLAHEMFHGWNAGKLGEIRDRDALLVHRRVYRLLCSIAVTACGPYQ